MMRAGRSWLALLLYVVALPIAFGAETGETLLGLNKTELLLQYMGTASGGDGSAAYRKVTRAMAQKSLDDAKDVGAAFVRVAVSGTMPVRTGQRGDLDLWQRDAQAHWRLVDEMMDDLAARGIKIVPVLVWSLGQFPAIAGEKVGALLRDPNSRSWKLAERYIGEFVTRYKGRPVILFYEIGNEYNLPADLNMEKRCAEGAKGIICGAPGNFTSDDLIAFTGRVAALIRSLDGSRKISSGYSVPRSSAEHLRRRPEWSSKGPDWTADKVADLERYLADTHQHVDIISAHIYPTRENQRLGAGAGEEYKLLPIIKQAADRIGKPLFVGEFGDMDARGAGPGGFSDKMLNHVVNLKIPYAAIWGWQFYIRKPYELYDADSFTLSHLEPGSTDYLIARFRQTAALAGAQVRNPAKADSTPPRVVLTWPLECAQVSKAQPVYAVASDDGAAPVERVEFWINDTLIDKKTKPPYQASLDPSGVKPGEYTLSARAYDKAGNKAEYSSVVLVNTAKASGATCAPAR